MRRLTVTLCLALFCAGGLTTSRGQEPAGREPAIEFRGSRAFTQQQLLDVAGECLTQYPPSQRRSSDALSYCMWKVKLFLGYQGYLRAEIGEPKAHAAGAEERLLVPVNEGPRYRLGEINIRGAELFHPAQLREMLGLKAGEVADRSVIDWLARKVRGAYGDRGYIQYEYEVEPIYRDPPDGAGEGVVDFTVTIDEGRRFTVKRVEFTGNAGVPEQALKQALWLREGDVFNRSLYEESVRELNRLGLFEEVDADRDVDFKAGDGSDQLVLVFRLKQRAKP